MTVPPSPRPLTLAKVATVLATVFMVAFGLCAVSALSGGLGSPKLMPFLIWVSVGTEAICLVGLLVIGGIALFRRRS